MENENHFPNLIKVQQFGDSGRLEIEKRGDTIIEHYIDLKASAHDHFDRSCNTVCTYKEKPNDITIYSNFYLVENGYRFYFDTRAVVAYCDSIISGLNRDPENITRQHYGNLKKYVRHQKIPVSHPLSFFPNFDQELILNFNAKIIEMKTGEKPKSLLIEFYTTEFSGGKTFYIIKNQGDTIELFDYRDYII